jgi:hypothetical protein
MRQDIQGCSILRDENEDEDEDRPGVFPTAAHAAEASLGCHTTHSPSVALYFSV